MASKNNNTIMKALDEYVYGHKEAKKALITMWNRSRLRSHQKWVRGMEDSALINPLKILLIAPSGTGKTHLVESLQKVVHFPLVRIDATQMNPAGSGSGGVKPDDLQKMIIKTAQACCIEYPDIYSCIESTVDRTVVFVDEIDKLGHVFESSGNWNKHVQSNFLTIFDNKCALAGVSFIFAGAFHDITNEQEEKKTIGFFEDKYVAKERFIDELVVKSGLIPELVGRINCIIELEIFNEFQLYKILKEMILPKKMRDLACYGIFNVQLKEKQLRKLVKDAYTSKQGIRYMQRFLDKMFLDREYETGVDNILKEYWYECD